MFRHIVSRRLWLPWVSALLLSYLAAPLTTTPRVLAEPAFDIPLPNLIVNTTAIADNPSDSKCDLWEALQAVFQANYGLSPTYHECTAKVNAQNIIGFSVVGGTITLPTAPGSRTDLPFVHGDTVIVGPITIAGNPAPADTHLLRTAPGATLTVVGVVLKNGHTAGAGPVIYSDNYATINVVGSFLTDNVADQDGGAIYSNGEVNLIGTSFINNQANGAAGRGGAVYLTGYSSVKIEASTFTANRASVGGAVYLQQAGGQTSIADSIFTANIATDNGNAQAGGAVFNASSGATLTIERTAFNANLGLQGDAGAFYNNLSAIAFITDTVFNGNIAGDLVYSREGGAIVNKGVLNIARSTFLANQSSANGAAIANEFSGQLSIANSTFNSNAASATGGALYAISSSSTVIRNSTFSANTASNGGSILSGAATIQVGNNILDRGGAAQANCSNTTGLVSLGHNVNSDSSCGLNAAGDQNNVSPLLAGLAFNGGGLPVLTSQMPYYGSPAIDHGDNAICASAEVNNEDQTGAQRPKDGSSSGVDVCDVGAVEAPVRAPIFDGAPLPPGPLNFGSVQVNTTLTTSFTLHNAGNYTLTVSGPSLGDAVHFGISTTFPINLLANGQTTVVLSCKPTAAGALQTTFAFNTTDADKPSVSYTLNCTGTPAPAPAFASLPTTAGPIDFGDVTLGQTVTKTITLKNNGTASLNLTGPAFSSDGGSFDYTPSFPLSMGIGASRPLTVTCTPSHVGPLMGLLSFDTNDTSQPHATYYLGCNGLAPQPAYMVNSQNIKGIFLPADFTGPAGVATSPDSQFAYVSGAATGGGQIVVLKKSALGSYLWNSQYADPFLANPHGVAVSPDGNFVAATGTSNDVLMLLQRDAGSGALTFLLTARNGLGGVSGLAYPWDVAFSPDGQSLYVTGYNSNSVAIFQRSGNTFSYSSYITATTMTTHTLTSPTGIVVSPDGKNVYVAAFATAGNGTLAVYHRNAVTGALTPIQTRYQGDCQDSSFICFPLNGLARPYELAISPDGMNVYATGRDGNALVNFRRDLATGLLHWNGSLIDSTGAYGLRGARGVAVSPDGQHVFTLGNTDQAFSIFDRDPETGYVAFSEVFKRNAGTGTPALDGVGELAVTNNGRYVFATAVTDNAVSVFGVANPVPTLFSLQPVSAPAGGAAFTLVVKGAGFMEGASVWWDSFQATTTYINPSELSAEIPANWFTSPGTPVIKVHNPSPGGGDSFNTLDFHVTTAIANPVPSIDHLDPAGVKAGVAGFNLDVYGSGFIASSLVVVNNGNQPLTTTFIDATHVRAAVPASVVAQPGPLNVQVYSDNYSNVAALDVAAPGQNPVPSIASLSPDWAYSFGLSSPQTIVTLTGQNFVDGAQAQFDGANRPTKFINASTLQVTLFGSDRESVGSYGLTVSNPTPGGGSSSTLTFTVKQYYALYLPMLMR